MTLTENRRDSKRFFADALLTLAGAVLFALANPGFIFSKGVPLAAWVMYVPAFMLVRRSSFKTVWLWGGVYGALSYCLYVSWLVTFHVVAAAAISVEYFFSYALPTDFAGVLRGSPNGSSCVRTNI